MSAEENRSAANLILMCQAHAKEIDDHPDRFSAYLLREWKRLQLNAHEEAVRRPLTDTEVEEVLERSFGLDRLAAAVAEVVPFSARSPHPAGRTGSRPAGGTGPSPGSAEPGLCLCGDTCPVGVGLMTVSGAGLVAAAAGIAFALGAQRYW